MRISQAETELEQLKEDLKKCNDAANKEAKPTLVINNPNISFNRTTNVTEPSVTKKESNIDQLTLMNQESSNMKQKLSQQ